LTGSAEIKKSPVTRRSGLRSFVALSNAVPLGPTKENIDMRVVVLVKASKESEAGEMPSEELVRQMLAFNEELVKAGVMLAADGLRPSSVGKRVVYSGKQKTIIDGPFAETKELVAGFWIWQVRSMEEAMEWAERCPNPQMQDGIIEIRPIFDAEEFAEASGMSDAVREQGRRVRKEMAEQARARK
jgi:hypothetical protein